MNREFIDKMREAKKMEAEALMLILPEKVRGHVEVIENELKEMFLECITDCAMNMGKEAKESSTTKSNTTKSRVQKVEID